MSAKKGTFGQWATSTIIINLFRVLALFPYHTRVNMAGRLVKGTLGSLTGYRKRVQKNLNHIYPDMPDAEKSKIADETLDNAGRCFVENAFPEGMYDNKDKITLWGDGVQTVLDAHANGQGIVFVSGHFGNHEAFRAALFEHEIRIGAIYRPMSNPFFNKHYEKWIDIGGRSGTRYPVGREGTKGFKAGLKNGEALILLIDLAVSSGEEMDFLGKPAMTSTAAAAFAKGSGALYIPYFAMRNPDKKSFSVEIAAPIEVTDPITMTNAANDILADRIHKDPGNWFWVHRRWKPWV